MADTVKVSLLAPQAYRSAKSEPFVHYRRGIVEMPREHAEALGVTRRIVREAPGGFPTPAAFAGHFDARLTAQLEAAGYTSIDSLRQASQDQLLAVDGIGPAGYERIQQIIRET